MNRKFFSLLQSSNVKLLQSVQINIEEKRHFLRFFSGTMFIAGLSIVPVCLYLASFGWRFIIYPMTTIMGLLVFAITYRYSFHKEAKKITAGIFLLIFYLHFVFMFQGYLHGSAQPFPCLFLITIIASRFLLPWIYTIALIVTSVLTIVATTLHDSNPLLLLTDQTASLVLALAVWAFGFSVSIALLAYLVAQMQKTFDQLEKRNQELLELSQRIEMVAENERGSIAHELHDVVVNPFETQLSWLESKLAEGLKATELSSSYQELVEVRQAMRRGLLNLHAAELKEHGLYAAMLYMTKRLSKDQPFKLTAQISDNLLEQELSENIQHTIYRITQQSLQNVIKHAEAKQVTVYLDIVPSSTLILKVSDDGKGFTVPQDFAALQASNHNGLAGFAQKVKLCGGILRIESQPECGTNIEVEIPIPTTPAIENQLSLYDKVKVTI
jgi:signal transduction histidine kinase